jgi:hypothetical protein
MEQKDKGFVEIEQTGYGNKGLGEVEQMEHETKGAEKKGGRARLVIFIVVCVAAVIFVFLKGYSTAKDKYAEVIEELEEENQQLSDPVAVYETASKEVDIHAINTEIQDIGELATIEYMYTDAAKFEDSKQLFGRDVPMTTKSFIAKWDGTIKAGIDISQVIAEENKKDKEIVVHIPKAEILSHDIDSDSVETLDQTNGLFNKVDVEDVREFDAVSKDAMEQRAIETGILDKAFENAKKIIEKLIDTDVVEEQGYTIVFETIE